MLKKTIWFGAIILNAAFAGAVGPVRPSGPLTVVGVPVAVPPVLAGGLAAISISVPMSAPRLAPALPLQAGPEAGASFAAFERLLEALPGDGADARRRRLNDFVSAQRGTLEGFPLRRGNEVLFVARSPEALALAGSWDGWSPSAMRSLEGTDYRIARAILPASDRYEYKFVAPGDRWTADPNNRKFTYQHGNSVVNLAGSGKSHLERHADVESPELGNTRHLDLYLPAGTLDSDERHPVVYMPDGQNVFLHDGNTWAVDARLDPLIEAGVIAKLIVAAIHNSDQHEIRGPELTYVPDEGLPARGPLYGDFVARRIKPLVDGLYPTRPGREDTAFVGSSLGGEAALWLALVQHPEIFGLSGALSPTLRWGSGSWALDPTLPRLIAARGKQPTKIYLDTGGVDNPNAADENDNWLPTIQLRDLLVELGWRLEVDLLYHWYPGAEHVESAWSPRFADLMVDWFGR